MKKICVLGLWHLGLVSAAGLADLGYEVVGSDVDQELLKTLSQNKLPLYEPGLGELTQKQISKKKLRFEPNLKNSVQDAQAVLFTYDTPVSEKDEVDLTKLERTLEAIAPVLDAKALVIINSQVPVGTCERWQKYLEKARPEASIDLVYSPENLRLGQAIALFKQPDMIVIGSNTERAQRKAEDFFSVFNVQEFFVSIRTAEMAKHALNAFFATSISFANELGNLCDALGADGLEIAKILKKDSRIGVKAQVRPGLGFAGGTLARDLRALQDVGRKTGRPTPLFNSVLEINEKQADQVVKITEEYFEGRLKDKTLTIFGLTYKPGTSTLRRSASLEIMKKLKTKGVQLLAHDPKADLSEYKGERFFNFLKDPHDAVKQSHGIILMTEWPEYRELDYSKIKKAMAGSFFLDAKNHLDGQKLEASGFTYIQIGKGQKKVKVEL